MDKKWHIEEKNGYTLVINDGGPTLGFSKDSGVSIIEDDGFAFKDLNKNGVLDPYEDWRLPTQERVKDLVSKMDLDSKLGLTLHDGMFMVMHFTPELLAKSPFLKARLKLMEKTPEELNSMDPTEPSEYNIELIEHDEMRFWLMGAIEGPEFAATYNNKIQKLAEGHKSGIPVFFSTNPRAFKDAHSDTLDRDVSNWPSNLGIGATFSPEVAKEMAETVSKEYRAMGITMELGPQIDLASDPRWSRMSATYSSDEKLNADLARAVCDGFQTSPEDKEIDSGWGYDSVLAMCKHWPGSTGEGGRESHSDAGKYTVYPGDNLSKHTYPWTEGAFKLDGPTKQTGAVMSCYDSIWEQGGDEAENSGASFNKYIVETLLRKENDFKGFVCTDFWITGNLRPERTTRPNVNAWGYTNVTPPERALKEWESGVDQLGGTNEIEIAQKAYNLALKRHGKKWADKRVNDIATRTLTFGFRTGSFENPYVDAENAMSYVGNSEHNEKGLYAHRKSVVMVKNKNLLPLNGKKVYIADKFSGGIPDRAGNVSPITSQKAISETLAAEYFEVVSTPEEADVAIVYMDSPQSGSGFNGKTKEIVPISIQYNDYTAVNAREESIAGDYVDGVKENRSYRGKSTVTYNKYDLTNLIDVKAKMGDKPVITVLRCQNPVVPSEFEPLSDAVLLTFVGTPDKVVLEILTGKTEPSGLLPFQMPESMDAVEAHMEDTPRDITPYTDSCGNKWDFSFGLNYSGVIDDERVLKYR
jgi:beta-glucosidase